MATSIATRRMMRERKMLEKENDDYVVLFKDDQLFSFDAYVIGPSDTLYSHKLIKLHFDITPDYPLKPPKCKFIQHSGGRIHPNLYVEGKVCLSILGTWEGEKWATAMTCETVLITIRSLLDNKPYTHEPGQPNNPSYNNYVQYGTWRWLLLDYLRHEREPKFQAFLRNYIAKHGNEMSAELSRQATKNAHLNMVISAYGGESLIVNYNSLQKDLQATVKECSDFVEATKAAEQEAEDEASVEKKKSPTDTAMRPEAESGSVEKYGSTATHPDGNRAQD